MPLQSSHFHRLPSAERIQERIAFYEERNRDISSFMWYIMPVAERFGERVYEVAAAALAESGLDTTAAQLKALAAEMKAPQNQARYAEARRHHINAMVTSYKTP
jgi:hypothetical protein